SRDDRDRRPQPADNIWVKYDPELTSPIGLLVALIMTLSLPAVAGSGQQMSISALSLDNMEWLKPGWRLIGLAFSI
ncbi:inner membrane protein YhjD, partial [Klebsiella pneumoniae]|nr:inner membrane protein YhjD [Klebsiella pneumoniae]